MPQTTFLLRPLRNIAAILTLIPALALAAGAEALTFDNVNYLHRWSKNGQNEFTPPAETDLNHWTDMVTINVVEQATDGDKLAQLANLVLKRYQAAGKVVRINSLPRSDTRPAEHYIAAVLGNPGFLEAVFARFVLVEGTGFILIHSHRIYGQQAGNDMAQWLQANGPQQEAALMAWNAMPSLQSLRQLPQSAQ
ncbi:hypothetical protein MKD49_21845 [Herbaspirillum sp. WGmk3]|uniref:hypothetical protein n=1 Tax=Herbaspirillum sp. WGmk3 TaxID=2919925 RepID=UPI00209062B8|nr:hypothetical protein [Herbaspirillum sp. WGmk3]MCO4859150.1 hypothetical protein [Herbaspirillum sp. WGmk3]